LLSSHVSPGAACGRRAYSSVLPGGPDRARICVDVACQTISRQQVAADAARLVEQHPQRDPVGVGPVRNRGTDRIVQVELAILRELDRKRGDKQLGNRENWKRCRGDHTRVRPAIGNPRAAGPEEPATDDDRRRHPGGAVDVALVVEHFLELVRARWVGHRGPGRLRVLRVRAATTRHHNAGEEGDDD
jgi:hypothetical protein